MNDKRKVLGRGLESLLPGRSGPTMVPGSSHKFGANDIPIEMIEPNPYQTRRHLREEALKELADSIKVSGVVQPVVVRPLQGGRYQLVAGERRWLASRQAGKTTIPAIVREISNEQAMEITIIENLQREDLNPVEQARAFERLSREFSLTQEQIATRTGKDRASIANFIRLLKLPEDVLDHLEKGNLTLGHGKLLCSLSGHADILAKVTAQVIAKNMSVRQTEELISELMNPEGAGKKKHKAKPVDPNVREAARTLERSLGVKVEIEDRKGKGKIVLRYASLEEFDRVVAALSEK